ncbi:MAG: hypothetical protein ABW034_21595 [Steroidobacteraceae bacterium]
MSHSKPRLVLYGTGQFGGFITRFAVDKDWPIVAAFNRAGPKIGQDLGRLYGLGCDLGVIVQDCDQANFDRLDADIGVIVMTDQLKTNFIAYERLMKAGLDVLCHGGESYFPFGSDPETAVKIDAMAKAQGVTFTGGGIWDMSRIWAGILVAGPCTELRALHHVTITDAQRNGLAQMLSLGVGLSPAEFIQSRVKTAGPTNSMYKTIPQHVLTGLGYTVTHVSEQLEPVVFDHPIHCRLLERELPAGTCVGTRIITESRTAEGVTAAAHIELRLFREGEIEHMRWEVDGMPRTRIRTEREDSSHFTCSSLFNRIPDVIAAKPGIQELYQLGPLRHSALT